MNLRSFAIAACLGLAACAGSPAAPAGPSLPPGPDHGRIQDGVYHDKVDWFSVALPLHPGEPGYDHLFIDEEYPKNVSYIAFAPVYLLDQGNIPNTITGEYYRVYVEDFYANHLLVPELPQLADMAMDFFGKQLVQQRVEPLRLVEEKPWHSASTQGILRLYTQKAPTTLLMQNLGLAEDYTAQILVYIATTEGKAFVVWTEWPLGCTPCHPVPTGAPTQSRDPIDQALSANGRAAAFIASFAYGKGV